VNYRIDIDGLRTIAVMLVIFNHVGFSFFSGGYVGVDVFFVISGFLITSIILPKVEKGEFSYTWFLSRRIKRLMPVLFFVILVSTVVYSFVLLPIDLSKFYASIIWVIFYGANFFFWREHGGYFDGGSSEVPLLHTWSLAVEEQYYFLWPLMLIIAFKLFKRHHVFWVSILLCLAAIYLSELGTRMTIGAAYYLLPTRFFELLVGSCLAIGWQRIPALSARVHHLISALGFTLILASSVLLTEHSSFPGYNAVYPVIGTALLIISSKGFVNKILSTKPFVFTGAISYSLYLWHWPVIVYFNYKAIELTLPVQIGIICLTYVLSIISWKYVEQRFRHLSTDSFKRVTLKMYLLPAALCLIIPFIGIYQKGFPERFNQSTLLMDEAVNSFSSDWRGDCHSAFRNAKTLPSFSCSFGDMETATKSGFIFGDSHANHVTPFFDELAKAEGISLIDYTMDQCLPIFGLDWGTNFHKAVTCKTRNDQAKQFITSNNFDYIVLAASWPTQETKRIFDGTERLAGDQLVTTFRRQFEETLKIIIQSGAKPIIVKNTPTLNSLSHKCPIKKALFNEKLNCSIATFENEMLEAVIRDFSKVYPSIKVVDLSSLFCKGNNCNIMLDGVPLYRDDNHLNLNAARYLAQLTINDKRNVFLTLDGED